MFCPCFVQDIYIDRSIHDPLEYANASSASHTYASPHVNLKRMFCPVGKYYLTSYLQ